MFKKNQRQITVKEYPCYATRTTNHFWLTRHNKKRKKEVNMHIEKVIGIGGRNTHKQATTI